ncbi:MAG: DUF6160 family protein [Pseudomonas sp.]|uniref:DUF6160 family protein n=1 Tax=Pseudomonas sp. TaxID=306 RepID=UPI003392CF0A
MRGQGWCALGLLAGCFSGSVQAMQPLDDDRLSAVTGQDGISLEISGGGWSAGRLDLTQDGQTLSATALSNRPQSGASSTTAISVDVVGDHLQIDHRSTPQVFSVGSLGFAGSDRSFGAFRAFYTLGGTLRLRGGGASGVTGLAVDDSRLSLTDVTFYYRDNGYDLIVKGLSFETYLNDVYLDVVSGGSGSEIQLSLGTSRFVGSIAAIGLDLAQGDPTPGVAVTPSAPDLRDANAGRSFGQFNMDLRLGGSIRLGSGGASGEGLRIKPDVSIADSLFQYRDEGVLRAEHFAGTLRSMAGITFDLEQDVRGSFVRLAFQDLRVSASLGGLILGNPNNPRLGSLAFDLNFLDQGNRQNWLKLRPGGDPHSGTQGLSGDLSWNLVDSSVSLTDNGNSLWFSGLRTHGTGQFSLDVTRGCAGGASPGCYAGTHGDMSQGNYDGHFDGLRFGLSGIKGSYSFDGLRVGRVDAPLQGGTELLVLMEIFPAYDFTLNGQLTLQPGGHSGDGLRYNADFYVSEANAAVTVDESGKGLWLAGTDYAMHYRDGTLDISNNGVELRKGSYWSKLDVHDLRWGDRASGTSLGRLVLQRYEQGSSMTLASGGAGALCVGGSGASASACAANGGRWEDRGNEGLSVKLKNVFVRDTSIETSSNGVATDEKRNQIILETNRVNGVNGTGSQLVVDNFHTSDGNPASPEANSYGFNADLSLDVAPTRVRIESGPNAGGYVTPDPLGFAVSGRVHFKEINVDRVQHVHPTGGAVTAMYGLKAQNADIRANLTATPIN